MGRADATPLGMAICVAASSVLGAIVGASLRLPTKSLRASVDRRANLENRLTAGCYTVGGKVIALKDLHMPMFVIGTETDHIAPWQSVYKVHLFTDNEITFVLTNGGHNAGIVSEPGHRGRHFRSAMRKPDDTFVDPVTWAAQATRHEGSWWPYWADWLASRSASERVAPCSADFAAA